MKKIYVLLFVLMLQHLVSGAVIIPVNAGSAEIVVEVRGYSDGTPVFLPVNDERQKVNYPSDLKIFTDEYGNTLVNLTGNYSLNFRVFVDASKPKFLDKPLSGTNDETDEFLGNTTLIVVDEETRDLALEIIGNTTSTLEAIVKLTTWVNNHVEYEFNNDIRTSKEVLEERKGACTEYANLYASLARSVGIPTRIVAGVTNTGTRWVRHAWAESLVGDTWVPVDPTYLEVGTKNAYSIKFYSGPSISGYMDSTEEIKVVNYSAKEFNLPIDIQASISEKTLAPRQKFSVIATITNKGSSVVIPTYIVQKSIGVTELDSFKKLVVVRPGETKTLEWRFLAPYGEKREYVLFFKGPNLERRFNFNVDPTLSTKEETSIEIEEIFAKGEEGIMEIDVTVRNVGNVDVMTSVKVITPIGTKQKRVGLNAGESKTSKFFFTAEPGNYSYIVLVSRDGEKISESGVVVVRKPPPIEQTFLLELGKYIRRYPVYSSVILLVVALVLFVILYPLISKPKRPFEERGHWRRLIKVEKPKKV